MMELKIIGIVAIVILALVAMMSYSSKPDIGKGESKGD